MMRTAWIKEKRASLPWGRTEALGVHSLGVLRPLIIPYFGGRVKCVRC